MSCLPASLVRYQFAYRRNRSTEDAVAIGLHTALLHLEQPGTYVRLLFVQFSSTLNTILPHKLTGLGLSDPICCWILDFLSDRPQRVRIGTYTSTTLSLSTGSPQGCVLSPLLFTLYTHDCSPTFNSNTFIKFADDTTTVGLISGGDESAYRDEVERLLRWYGDNNLVLNTMKTKEIVVGYRRNRTDIQPLFIGGVCV